MKIRIQNDGKPSYMTKITDAETGKAIHMVGRVEVNLVIDAGNRDPIPRAIMTVFMPVVDIIADAEIKQVCPVCGREKEL